MTNFFNKLSIIACTITMLYTSIFVNNAMASEMMVRNDTFACKSAASIDEYNLYSHMHDDKKMSSLMDSGRCMPIPAGQNVNICGRYDADYTAIAVNDSSSGEAITMLAPAEDVSLGAIDADAIGCAS